MDINKYIAADPDLQKVIKGEETIWWNPNHLPFAATESLCELIVSDEDIEDASERLKRFAPFIEKMFEETREQKGIIESPLVEIPSMKQELMKREEVEILGRLFLKKDSHLPIAGSIKARGGIYEVLKHAEDLALEHGMIRKEDSYEAFAHAEMREFFHQYTVQVGSTGNLGLSIGIISAALGFQVIVHMSMDAKSWKKDLLRSKGVTVIEYAADYSKAVEEGRRRSEENPKSYFVDDEKSVNLFLGYAVAAKRLQKQLKEMQIVVDKQHPLIVTIPAGVGGAPGGVSYGLKRIFKDDVHCFFAEPVNCPSVLLGMATGLHEKAKVTDFGLSAITQADGLACGSPSGFVTRIMRNLLSADVTVEDERLYKYMRLLYKTEGEFIEPSSCAMFFCPVKLYQSVENCEYARKWGWNSKILEQSTNIVWATGGSLVPESIKEKWLKG